MRRVPDTYFVSFNAANAFLGIVPDKPGSPGQPVKTWAGSAKDWTEAVLFETARLVYEKDPTFPTVNGPTSLFQVQMTVGGGPPGATVRLTGLNPGFGFTDPHEVGIVFDANGNLLSTGFGASFSSSRLEVGPLAAGAQPSPFTQPFSFDCVKMSLARSALDQYFSEIDKWLRAEKLVSPTKSTRAWTQALLKEARFVEDADSEIKLDKYKSAIDKVPQMMSAQKALDLASARAAAQIKDPKKKKAFEKFQQQEDADANTAFAASKQMITPATT